MGPGWLDLPLHAVGLAGISVFEYAVHNDRAAADGGDDHVAVDGLGDVRGFVAYGVADLLDRNAVAAHDRDCGVAALVSVPVADAGLPGHLGKAPVERVGRVHGAVLVAEDEIVGVLGVTRLSALSVLPSLMCLESGDGALRQDERSP